MPLTENDLFWGQRDKIETAMARLKQFEPVEGYYLAFSGGKDSIVLKKLVDLAGVKYDAHYSNTTIDPPELIYFIRKYHPDVSFENPDRPLLGTLEIRGFPLAQHRWCCNLYKETGGTGRLVLTGVRWQESNRRRKRQLVENCYKDTSKRYVNPIIDWRNSDVWDFIKNYNLSYCSLYDEGWTRIGCLFCPNAKTEHRMMQVLKYPKYTKLFIRAFERLYNNRKRTGAKSVNRWNNGREMFNWWIAGQRTVNPDQMVMFE